MEKEGLVVRKVDPSDRRNNRIYRTEKADTLWDSMMECASKVKQVAITDISEADINIMRTVLDKIWHNLGAEFSVSCATLDNNAIVVEALSKNSSNLSSNTSTSTSGTNNNDYSTTRTTAATDKIIPTTLTSINKRKE